MAPSRREFVRAVGAGAAAAWVPAVRWARVVSGQRPPNVVFILVDDLGWTDTAVYGSTFYETPHVDRLAAEGIRFTDAYAASPVCSPTRASILTGKHPARLHITDWIGGNQRGMLLPAPYEPQLPLEEVTLAELLSNAGYATALIGKWHLGDGPFLPQHQGFDVNIGGHGAGHPATYFYPYRAPAGRPATWDVPDLEAGAPGEYLTDRLTDEALRFITAQRDRPFLLFLSHYAVHTPIEAKADLEAKYRAKAASRPAADKPDHVTEHGRASTRAVQEDPAYAGMVASVDDGVGRILGRLADLDLANDTIVILMSDNGGLSTLAGTRTGPTANLPLRAGKGWLYEGGIRVPLIVRWPGVVAPGRVSAEPVLSTDFVPTLLAAAGLGLQPDLHPDGRSLLALLRGNGRPERDALHWHFPHYHGSGNRPGGAIRAGRYKLIEWFEDGQVELYDLERDLGERQDLSATMPERTAELRTRLAEWRRSVDAWMPAPNPEYR